MKKLVGCDPGNADVVGEEEPVPGAPPVLVWPAAPDKTERLEEMEGPDMEPPTEPGGPGRGRNEPDGRVGWPVAAVCDVGSVCGSGETEEGPPDA